ncbi:hypothetical protein F2Q70_00035310 [Brassica cretica]|uniref:Uncharacterized protein n=1 Tax=Brassica cretica TaxID=69181 RepID=A0A8S9GHR2_BRACR|nr:hypothetical protein F2Q68_00030432 [Brassica cretica]KAF2586107.1 hypothetical protein F2Q70_00035310 [Brassica cretica]
MGEEEEKKRRRSELRSNRRALFSTEWKEEKREMDKTELEINAKDAGDCRHLDFCISFMVTSAAPCYLPNNAIKLLYEVKVGELEKRGVALSWGP